MGFSLKDFEELIKRADEVRRNRPFVMYGSADTIGFMQASLRGDKEEMNRIGEKISEDIAKRKSEDMIRLSSAFSENEMQVFRAIDGKYKFWHGLSHTISSYGSQYLYVWEDKDIEIPFEDTGKHPLKIMLWHGKWHLYVYYCDESGYYQGYHYLHRDVSSEDILPLIEEVKNQYSL